MLGTRIRPRPTPAPYMRRFVAFIDILGWENACCDARRYSEVFAVAKTLSELPKNFSQKLKCNLNQTKGAVPDPSHQETEVVTFSDSLVISTTVDGGYSLLFKFVTFICLDLLTQGFPTRGGVTVGELYHKENIVFGPALNCAVRLEKEAIYPRLLCSHELVENIKESGSSKPSDLQLIINDRLGRSVVNLLAYYPAAWEKHKERSPRQSRRVAFRTNISKNGVISEIYSR